MGEMEMAKILWGVVAVFGVLLTALGLLWALQGADLVHIEPVACVTNCESLEGFSTTWLAAGIAAMVAGVIIVRQSVRRLSRRALSSGP